MDGRVEEVTTTTTPNQDPFGFMFNYAAFYHTNELTINPNLGATIVTYWCERRPRKTKNPTRTSFAFYSSIAPRPFIYFPTLRLLLLHLIVVCLRVPRQLYTYTNHSFLDISVKCTCRTDPHPNLLLLIPIGVLLNKLQSFDGAQIEFRQRSVDIYAEYVNAHTLADQYAKPQ